MKSPKGSKSREYYLLAFRIIGDFGASIAIPVVVFVLIGQYLDGKYDKGPWFTIAAFILAALVSVKIIYRKAKQYGAEFKKLNESTRHSEKRPDDFTNNQSTNQPQ